MWPDATLLLLSWTDISLGPGHRQSDRPGARWPLQMDHMSVLGAAPHVSEGASPDLPRACAEKSSLTWRAQLPLWGAGRTTAPKMGWEKGTQLRGSCCPWSPWRSHCLAVLLFRCIKDVPAYRKECFHGAGQRFEMLLPSVLSRE